MEVCELREIETNKPLIRHNLNETGDKDDCFEEDYVHTSCGRVLVAKHGAPFKNTPYSYCLLTYHDIGLNYKSNFISFFSYPTMKPVLERLTIFHINAPGQESKSPDLNSSKPYPTMDELADSIKDVCDYYDIKRTICFGVGLGANVMARFASKYPDLTDGLFIVNPVPTSAGWVEWGYQKRNIYYLSQVNSINYTPSTFPQCIIDYLMWHHLGRGVEYRVSDLYNMYKTYFSSFDINPKNLALLINSYVNRDDIGIDISDKAKRAINCNTLILAGHDSPFLEDSVNMNVRIDLKLSTWMKLFDCSMPLDEQPAKSAQAFILFVQGLGLGLLSHVR